MRTPPTPTSIDCLSGLSLVFTGELPGFSRDEAVSLAKRYGARVVGQPSSKTSFVILGNDAGASKLKVIDKHKLSTLDEDGFMNLIATRKGPSAGGKVDDKTRKKMEKEEEEIKQGAKELAKREKEASKAAKSDAGSGKSVNPLTQLWTVRYAPKSLKEICGNKGQIEKLQQWLGDWSGSLKSNFKKPGKNGTNIYRAMLISGPPGIGKTTSAHLCAQLAGFTPIEMNASDARSKKLIENGANIMNQSLDKWMSGKGSVNAMGVEISSRSCLIMDEVDGMSAGDRGGVGALAALIRKSRVPIICIANDRGAQKLKPLVSCAFNLPFKKPEATMIRSRIMTILYKEKMKVPPNVVDQLVEGAQSDIRQVLNMLSTWRLSSNTMDFDESKSLVKMNEKYSSMTPFTIIQKLLGPYVFSPNARETLNDKMEFYFHDHSFVPLFVQENYLKTTPSLVRNTNTPREKLKLLRLMDRAAASLSDADMVDSLIHGPEQHWSLMPLHAITSTVIPASCMYGNTSYTGTNMISFPQWLGQNSKQNKLMRQLGDIQVRMRLKVSGDKPEIRQHYIPALFPHIVQPLVDNGASAVEEVIETMDEYFLSKDEWDTLVELGVGSHKDELVLKKVAPATKTSFTKKYNSRDHPVPFHKGQDLGKLPKKLAAEPAPDLEEAYDNDDEIPDDDDDDKKKPLDELASDKLIKTRKPKASTAAKPSTKAKKPTTTKPRGSASAKK